MDTILNSTDISRDEEEIDQEVIALSKKIIKQKKDQIKENLKKTTLQKIANLARNQENGGQESDGCPTLNADVKQSESVVKEINEKVEQIVQENDGHQEQSPYQLTLERLNQLNDKLFESGRLLNFFQSIHQIGLPPISKYIKRHLAPFKCTGFPYASRLLSAYITYSPIRAINQKSCEFSEFLQKLITVTTERNQHESRSWQDLFEQSTDVRSQFSSLNGLTMKEFKERASKIGRISISFTHDYNEYFNSNQNSPKCYNQINFFLNANGSIGLSYQLQILDPNNAQRTKLFKISNTEVDNLFTDASLIIKGLCDFNIFTKRMSNFSEYLETTRDHLFALQLIGICGSTRDKFVYLQNKK